MCYTSMVLQNSGAAGEREVYAPAESPGQMCPTCVMEWTIPQDFSIISIIVIAKKFNYPDNHLKWRTLFFPHRLKTEYEATI